MCRSPPSPPQHGKGGRARRPIAAAHHDCTRGGRARPPPLPPPCGVCRARPAHRGARALRGRSPVPRALRAHLHRTSAAIMCGLQGALKARGEPFSLPPCAPSSPPLGALRAVPPLKLPRHHATLWVWALRERNHRRAIRQDIAIGMDCSVCGATVSSGFPAIAPNPSVRAPRACRQSAPWGCLPKRAAR